MRGYMETNEFQTIEEIGNNSCIPLKTLYSNSMMFVYVTVYCLFGVIKSTKTNAFQ